MGTKKADFHAYSKSKDKIKKNAPKPVFDNLFKTNFHKCTFSENSN